jgi:FkbM family methyltransferase
LPEPSRRRLFEVVPGASATAARWQARLERDGGPAAEVPAPSPVDADGDQPYFRLRRQDVVSGYRLLLHRDPDETEIESHLTQAAGNLEYDLYHFTDLLLTGPDRERALAALHEPLAGSLDGLTFYYRPSDTVLGAAVAHYGSYEPDVAHVIERYLPEGGTYIDIGANIGLHAIRGARAVGPTGRVICYEPSPDNVESLTMTMAVNGFDRFATVRPVAAGDKPGQVPLHARRGQSNATVEQGDVRWPSDIQVLVPSIPLDDELLDLDRIDLIKMDVEGCEPLVVMGMIDALKKHRPSMIFEFFPDAIRRTSGHDPLGFLVDIERMGYKLLPFIPGRGAPTEASTVETIAKLPAEHRVTHVDVLAEPS